MPNRYVGRCSTSPATGVSTGRGLQHTENSNSCRGCEGKVGLLSKLNTQSPDDIAILLLGRYPRELRQTQREACSHWSQKSCPQQKVPTSWASSVDAIKHVTAVGWTVIQAEEEWHGYKDKTNLLRAGFREWLLGWWLWALWSSS